MSAVAATRTLLLVGDRVSCRKFHSFSRLGLLYDRVRFLSHVRNQKEAEPLTLASFGLRSEISKTDGNEISIQKQGVSTIEVPKRREKKVASKVIHGVKKGKIDLQGLAPFAAKSFSELGLPTLMVERLEKEGYKVPTDVQAAAIPSILNDHDVVIQSYTGSGKTLAYLLPILSELGPFKENAEARTKMGIEAVVVAPSRELGMQIVREFERVLGPVDKRLVQQLVGGANRSRQEEALKKNKPMIVVGTPGRIAEISAAGKLHTHGCRYLVLDEVDELLAFNFRESMHRILEHVGRRSSAGQNVSNGTKARRLERQMIMVSATVPFSVIRAARSWGNNPLLVQDKRVIPLESIPAPGAIKPSESPDSSSSNEVQSHSPVQSLPPSLTHYYSVTRIQHKVDTLRRCIHALDAKCVIAFMNHTKQLKDAVFKLEARGMKAAELHGDLNKLARSTILKRFKNGDVRVLLTNELSARGLDIPECDLVVNLELPTDSIHYAHRAGRTGRLGRIGTVVTICEEPEVFVVKKMQKQLGVVMQACEFAEGKLVVEKDEKNVEASRNQSSGQM
ncbi:DEAD-box ATP-dependent RNA helicase 47A isoform X1 [Andrographis paniculata]|uniref:DEAD-box ATP-dependent RNA helicase 47A isoform X1 n=1 Tax=Andrographis paniculata TaxID=175694 RepID=UPI0021E86A44|nr:DEAD-box ATP-dependent RNA helicase 47A isoform X1 [Andrographis paniculata]